MRKASRTLGSSMIVHMSVFVSLRERVIILTLALSTVSAEVW